MVNILSLVIKYFLKSIIYQVNKYFIILHYTICLHILVAKENT